jgi:protein Mpv17
MIRTSCAWARASSRRTQNEHAYPRNPNYGAGNTTSSLVRGGWTPQRTTVDLVVKRHSGDKAGQKVPAPATTIPGPNWLWLEPIYGPFRAYGRVQQRRPYVTQLVSSLVIYFVGDLVAQSIAAPADKEVIQRSKEGLEGSEDEEERGWVQQWGEDRDWARTGRALVIGGMSSIPSYKWFLWLGNNFNYSSKILSLTTKVRLTPLSLYAFSITSNYPGRRQPGLLHTHLQLIFLRHADATHRRHL